MNEPWRHYAKCKEQAWKDKQMLMIPLMGESEKQNSQKTEWWWPEAGGSQGEWKTMELVIGQRGKISIDGKSIVQVFTTVNNLLCSWKLLKE